MSTPPVVEVEQADARRRLIRFAALGIAAFAVAMVWTLPASVLVSNRPWRSGVSGTIWNGEVGIAGGSVVEWHWAPLRSLTSLGFAVDWTATGGSTDLGGQALLRPGSVRLDRVSGAADALLLQALAPALPFTCDLALQVEMPVLRTGDGAMADARALSDPGSCAATAGGLSTPVPALAITAEHVGRETRIRVAPQAQRRRTLVDATLAEDGRLTATLTPDGAAVLPFTGLPPGAAITL